MCLCSRSFPLPINKYEQTNLIPLGMHKIHTYIYETMTCDELFLEHVNNLYSILCNKNKNNIITIPMDIILYQRKNVIFEYLRALSENMFFLRKLLRYFICVNIIMGDKIKIFEKYIHTYITYLC